MDGSRRKVIGRTDVQPSEQPSPNVTVRAKISHSSITKNGFATTSSLGVKSPSITPRSRSPVRGSPVSRPLSTVYNVGGTLVSSSSSSIGFVPKAKKTAILPSKQTSAAENGSQATASLPNINVSGASPRRHASISSSQDVWEQARSTSRSNTPTRQQVTPAAPPTYRSPAPRLHEQGHQRLRAGSISDDGLSSTLSSNMSPDTTTDYGSVSSRRPQGPFLSAMNNMSTIGAPIRVRAKVSHIILASSPPQSSSLPLSPKLTSPASSTLSSRPISSPSVVGPSPFHRQTRSNSIHSLESVGVDSPPKRQLPPLMSNGIRTGHRRTASSVQQSPTNPFSQLSRRPSTSNVPSTLSRSNSSNGTSAKSPTGHITRFTGSKIHRARSKSGGSASLSSEPGGSSLSTRTTSIVNDARPRQLDEYGDDVDNDDGEQFGTDQSNVRTAAREAKSNRKIADLEITNRSLLAINSMLEADKLRLSQEIRDLRRRVREQRLSLPPEAYRALVRHEKRTATANEDDGDAEAPLPLSEGFADDDDEEDEDKNLSPLDPEYERITALVDALLFHAHDALKHNSAVAQPTLPRSGSSFRGSIPSDTIVPDGLIEGTGSGGVGPKVLTSAEVEMHYGQMGPEESDTSNSEDEEDEEGRGDDIELATSMEPEQSGIFSDDDDSFNNDEFLLAPHEPSST